MFYLLTFKFNFCIFSIFKILYITNVLNFVMQTIAICQHLNQPTLFPCSRSMSQQYSLTDQPHLPTTQPCRHINQSNWLTNLQFNRITNQINQPIDQSNQSTNLINQFNLRFNQINQFIYPARHPINQPTDLPNPPVNPCNLYIAPPNQRMSPHSKIIYLQRLQDPHQDPSYSQPLPEPSQQPILLSPRTGLFHLLYPRYLI